MSRLRLPRTIDDAKDLGRLFSKYKDTHYYTVLGAIVATYILYPSNRIEVYSHVCVAAKHCAYILVLCFLTDV